MNRKKNFYHTGRLGLCSILAMISQSALAVGDDGKDVLHGPRGWIIFRSWRAPGRERRNQVNKSKCK